MRVEVRKAEVADMAAVFQLVRELADYEKAGHEVETSAEQYRRDYAAGDFECLVAIDNTDTVVGTMIFFMAYSTWKGRMLFLEDFVVAQAQRRSGIGSSMWASLIELAEARDCTSMKWQVLDWNEPAIAFYRGVGADLESEWDNGRLWLKKATTS